MKIGCHETVCYGEGISDNSVLLTNVSRQEKMANKEPKMKTI